MKRLFTLLLVLCALPALAQDYGQDMTIKIWDNSSAPHSNEITAAETSTSNVIVNTTETVLYIFKADPAKATGHAMLVCPGGGYSSVCIEWEGYKVAQWLASQGVTCGVLKYRLPNGHKEIPLEDTTEALRSMRRRSKELGFDPSKLGMMGSSAGGHLTAYTSNFAAFADRPAFTVLFYPVITGEEGLCHKGSFDHLLGKDASAYERSEYSMETRVTKNTPPTLILTSDNDTLVPTISSTRYYNALRKHGVKASLHIYPGGYHGFCMHDDVAFKPLWQQAMIEWIRSF
ncbi:MAG: alpha/beta hydrolase [Alistipes sp.]|nr:alpha/beta hydrolase [Alistipes sp.]